MKLSVIHTHTHRAKNVCSTSKSLPAESFQQAKPNRKPTEIPTPPTGKFIVAKVIITYMKRLSELCRHTQAK